MYFQRVVIIVIVMFASLSRFILFSRVNIKCQCIVYFESVCKMNNFNVLCVLKCNSVVI